MKKLIVSLVAVLIVFGAFMSWNQKNMPSSSAIPISSGKEAAPSESTDAAAEEIKVLDYTAIRNLHPDSETAVTLGEETLDWGFYADFLRTNGMQYEDYFRQMAAYYGVAAQWAGSSGDGMGNTYAQQLVSETNDTLGSFMAIHELAREKGIALDEEGIKALEPEQMAVDICGEGATVEKLAETLEEGSHMTIDGFRYYSESIGLYSKLYTELFGVNGEKLSEDIIIKALEEKGYLSAGHILFMTIDPMTGNALDEKTISDKLEQANKLVEELRKIENKEERAKKFIELKEQYCEDTGKATYPEGYTFTPGTMVPEFESTVSEQEPYEVSDPVKTSYGYHIIMRLPLDSEGLLFSSMGTPETARRTIAQEEIARILDEYYEANPPQFMEGLEDIDLLQYIK